MTGVSEHIPSIAANNTALQRALLLAGGGMRVAYQAGAILALYEQGKRFSHADGASGGTINLAALLSGVSPQELCQRWRTLNIQQFASVPPPETLFKNGGLEALGSAEGLIEHIYPGLGIDIPKINAAHGIDGSFNVCRFDTKTVVPIPHTEINQARLVAGASLPIFMPAVEDQGVYWTDAVWIQDANLLSCIQRGARELWLIWCIGNTPEYKTGSFNQYVHMIEMSAIGALNKELDAIAALNEQITQGHTVWGHTLPIVVHVIKPQFPLPLDPDFYLGRIDASTLINLGYQDAYRYLDNASEQGSPLNYKATQMNTPHQGISFRETMSGSFQLGITDPNQCDASAQNTPLSMHATIHIHDIDAFVKDPEHRADLSGHIDFTPFGTALPATIGVFQLFAPSIDPNMTYMVYELGFQHQGTDYYLAGKKHVHVGGIWNLWSETTTLYTTLHKGKDNNGEIIGAGTLTLGVSELMKLLSTLQATDSHSLGESFSATQTFFSFFGKELVKTYVMHKGR
jgi:predicted acylesterase/phospholipase RssA